MRLVKARSGLGLPVLGQGSWGMGERRDRRAEEVAALQLGIDLGMTLIDTAEMYAEGEAERVVGEAIAKGRRDSVLLVSKVYPHNATKARMIAACENSLRRLGTDRLDLYLLHWRGNVPLEETLGGARSLIEAGKIRFFGVSNFDRGDVADWMALDRSIRPAANQILYNLGRRGADWDLLPACRRDGIPVMAYSPIEQGRLLRHAGLVRVAKRLAVPPAVVALAWVVHQDNVVAIPKATSLAHVRENRAALDLTLGTDDLAELDAAFPPPTGPTPLAML
ncbi:MAG TPA: aldo/keto reductase [Stellaceae bacterium]|nr:aldo/keto reductase [Stellaceae bacterium]